MSLASLSPFLCLAWIAIRQSHLLQRLLEDTCCFTVFASADTNDQHFHPVNENLPDKWGQARQSITHPPFTELVLTCHQPSLMATKICCMVPTLIYLLYKRMIRRRWPVTCQKLEDSLPSRSSFLIAGLLIILMLATLVLAAQQQTLQYAVMHKGSEIGWLFIQKKTSNSMVNYLLQSEVRVRFLFLFTGSAQEETRFENGKLVYSRLYRKMNGKVKANKCTRFNGKEYEVQKGNNKEKIELPSVTYNQHSLYFQEPVHESVMYSDSFQQFIHIERMGNGVYRLKMPDGAINFFHYKNGICSWVRIENTMHSADIILKP